MYFIIFEFQMNQMLVNHDYIIIHEEKLKYLSFN